MIECQICSKKYNRYSDLSRHINKIHPQISSKEYYDKYFKKDGEDICECGKQTKFLNIQKGYQQFCSVKCSRNSTQTQKKYKETCLKNYGVDNPLKSKKVKDKIIETNLKRYGVKSHNSLNNIKEKKKKTCLDKYGVENSAQSKKVKDKIIETNLKRYGVTCAFQGAVALERAKFTKIEKYKNKNYNNLEKAKDTCLKRYRVEHAAQSEIIKEKQRKKIHIKFYKNKILKFKNVIPLFNINEFDGTGYYNKKYNWQCKECNDIFEHTLYSRIPICKKCHPRTSGTSMQEKEVQDFVSKYITSENNKMFYANSKRLELDIYIPSLKLGIEYNGLYWHSELQGSDKNYHLEKTNWFKENFDIDVIHIFENEWVYKEDIIKSIILNKLGLTGRKIFARKCIISSISPKCYREFLDDNHAQGAINSKFKYGLFFNDELVSCIGFGKSRFKENELELHRYCNKINTSVVGGFSRLLKHFTKNEMINGSNLITYCDKRYSNGNVYLKNGFKPLGESGPNYWYFDKIDYVLKSRMQFQKHKLVNILNEFNPKLTEWENMQLNGWNRIWDCGNYIFNLEVNILTR